MSTPHKLQIRACPRPHSRAAPSVEAHHRVSGPNTGRNCGGRQIKKDKNVDLSLGAKVVKE